MREVEVFHGSARWLPSGRWGSIKDRGWILRGYSKQRWHQIQHKLVSSRRCRWNWELASTPTIPTGSNFCNRQFIPGFSGVELVEALCLEAGRILGGQEPAQLGVNMEHTCDERHRGGDATPDWPWWEEEEGPGGVGGPAAGRTSWGDQTLTRDAGGSGQSSHSSVACGS